MNDFNQINRLNFIFLCLSVWNVVGLYVDSTNDFDSPDNNIVIWSPHYHGRALNFSIEIEVDVRQNNLILGWKILVLLFIPFQANLPRLWPLEIWALLCLVLPKLQKNFLDLGVWLYYYYIFNTTFNHIIFVSFYYYFRAMDGTFASSDGGGFSSSWNPQFLIVSKAHYTSLVYIYVQYRWLQAGVSP